MKLFRFFYLSIFSLLLFSCNEDAKVNSIETEDHIATIYYSVDSIAMEPEVISFISWQIKNQSNETWSPSEWTLHFNQLSGSPIASTITDYVKFNNQGGDYAFFSFDNGIGDLIPGQSLSFSYQMKGVLRRMSNAPLGLFIVKDNQAHDISQVTIRGIDNEMLKALNPTGAQDLYAAYEKLTQLDNVSPIVPTPTNISIQEGTLLVDNELTVELSDDNLNNELTQLKEEMSRYFSGTIRKENNGILKMAISPAITTPESYQMVINNEGISLNASDPAGIYYGIQSLVQLLSPEFLNNPQSSLTLPHVQIEDQPRFAYRGFMLDVARNYHRKDKVLEVLDHMAHYKLNKFHFHLMDDEGWRLEIPGLPELTEVGSVRGYTTDESDRLHPSYGSGGVASKSYSTGYYTKEDYQDILKYAADRHIEVIPEIDIPGHARAAIIAMKNRYNRFMEAGQEEKAKEYMLHDPADTSKYWSAQNYDDNVINLCQSSAYNFIEKVITETIKMHDEAGIPLKTLHTGGDEVPFGAWEGSPLCQSFISDMENLSGTDDLHPNMLAFVRSILVPRGIVTAGWEEIALKHSDKGHNGTDINEKLIGEPMLPYVWNAVTGWGREDMAYKLANVGYDVVMCNSSAYYFDLAYDGDSREGGLAWSGLNNTKIVFDCEPLDLFKGVTTDVLGRPLENGYWDDKVRLKPEAVSKFKGIQAELWSETLVNADLVDYMLFPKLLAFAERAWSQSIADQKLSNDVAFNIFTNKVGKTELQRLDNYSDRGVQYRIPSPGISIENGNIIMNRLYPGLQIRYTLDDSEPNAQSPIYTNMISVGAAQIVKAKCFNSKNRSSRVSVLNI